MLKPKAIIVGAGIAGIATAIRLQKQGYEVIVFDSASVVGGKIKSYKWQNFRFDTGPSLFTLPKLVDDIFELCGKNPRQYFDYQPLKLVTKYFYSDGITIDSYSNPEKFAEEVELKLQVKKSVIHKFLQKQKRNYELLAPIFLENPIHIFSRLLKIKNIPALICVSNPILLFPMNLVNSYIFKNKYLTKIFNRYGTYNGSNPYKMPSLFNIISHLEHNVGAYLPSKGMVEIVNSLNKLALEMGVQFRLNSFVDEIIIENNTAIGVISNQNKYFSDIVISNMDVDFSYKKLLKTQKAPSIHINTPKSTSALIFHWAINKNFSELDVHNIMFADNYKAEFEYLFNKKITFFDPTIYVYISSKQVPKDAPNDSENWFVMINMPHLTDKNIDYDIDNIKKIITDKINKQLKTDINKYIIHENITTPQSLQNTTHSYLGSLYGGSSNTILSAFLRHPNFSSIKKMYFCGGTVHPGGGIPLCLLSAKITSELIAEKYNF